MAELQQVKRFIAPGSPLAPPIPAGMEERIRAHVYGLGEAADSSRTETRKLAARLKAGCILGRRWLNVPIYGTAVLLLLLLLFVVGILGSLWPGSAAASPAEATAAASIEEHTMCQNLGEVPQSLQGDANQVRAQLAGAVGVSVAMPRSLPADYVFVGGRAFRAASTEAAHLAWMRGKTMLSFYQSPDPGGTMPSGWRAVKLDSRTFWLEPVSASITPGTAGTVDTAETAGSGRAVLWRDSGVLYMLVGDLSETELLTMALSVNAPYDR
jgi:anti-sigma factor RsiW